MLCLWRRNFVARLSFDAMCTTGTERWWQIEGAAFAVLRRRTVDTHAGRELDSPAVLLLLSIVW